MKRALITGIGSGSMFGWMALEASGGNSLVASSYAFWGFVAGAVIGWMATPEPDAWEIDNPLPRSFFSDAATAIHAIKGVLLEPQPGGWQWRILNIDPALGILTASLDLVEPAAQAENRTTDARMPLPGTAGVSPALPTSEPDEAACQRRNILLIAEAKRFGAQVQLTLRWRVRGGVTRVLCNQAIRLVSARIACVLSQVELASSPIQCS